MFVSRTALFDLASADEGKPAKNGTLEELGLVELEHNPRNNRIRVT